jgi:hypothetical protein
MKFRFTSPDLSFPLCLMIRACVSNKISLPCIFIGAIVSGMVKAKQQFKVAHGDNVWSLQADSADAYQKVLLSYIYFSPRDLDH